MSSDRIARYFELSRMDAGEFARFRASGMTFTIDCWQIEGLGHCSVVRASGMLGLMRMDTIVIDPLYRDAPLFSYDRITAGGKITLLLELYDTLLSERVELPELQRLKAQYATLPDHDLGSHWYDHLKLPVSLSKRCPHSDAKRLDALAEGYLDAYMRLAANSPHCDYAAKRERAASYVDGLLEHGGPSTDSFCRLLGKEKTRELFRGVIFGIEARESDN